VPAPQAVNAIQKNTANSAAIKERRAPKAGARATSTHFRPHPRGPPCLSRRPHVWEIMRAVRTPGEPR
jgi:hypothetical protein